MFVIIDFYYIWMFIVYVWLKIKEIKGDGLDFVWSKFGVEKEAIKHVLLVTPFMVFRDC